MEEEKVGVNLEQHGEKGEISPITPHSPDEKNQQANPNPNPNTIQTSHSQDSAHHNHHQQQQPSAEANNNNNINNSQKTNRLESLSYDSNSERIIFYNATTMISDIETHLMIILWIDHLCLELLADVMGIVDRTLHLYLDYRLLISCLNKPFKSKDLSSRAIERRHFVVAFILNHLYMSQSRSPFTSSANVSGRGGGGGGEVWVLGLDQNTSNIRKDRRRSVSAEVSSSSNNNNNSSHSPPDSNEETLANSLEYQTLHHQPQQQQQQSTNHTAASVELSTLIRPKPTSLREYSYKEFMNIFCSLELNSSEQETIGIPSLREIMKRQSVAVNGNGSTDTYDQYAAASRSIRRHTFDFLEPSNANSSMKSTKANVINNTTAGNALLGKVWLNKEEEGEVGGGGGGERNSAKVGMRGGEGGSLRLNFPSMKSQPPNSGSIKPSADQQFPPIISPNSTNTSFLPRIEGANVNNPPILISSRASGKTPPPVIQLDNNNPQAATIDYEALRNLTVSPTDDGRKRHVYDFLLSGENSEMEPSKVVSASNPPNKNSVTSDGVLTSKSNVHLPKISNSSHPNPLIANALLGTNNNNDNSTGNISNHSAPPNDKRRKSVGNPMPYDLTPIQSNNSPHSQPRRSFELGTSLSSAIQTLARGVQLNRPLRPLNSEVPAAANGTNPTENGNNITQS